MKKVKIKMENHETKNIIQFDSRIIKFIKKFRITCENNENQEVHGIPGENDENHKKHGIIY